MASPLLQNLMALVATNIPLATIAPPFLKRVTDRIPDPLQKRNAVWGLCFAGSLLAAALQGAFSPIVPLWEGVPHTGAVGVLNAAYQTFLIVSASFGVCLVVTTQAHDKFWKNLDETRAQSKAAKVDAAIAGAQADKLASQVGAGGIETGPGSVLNSLQRISGVSVATPTAPSPAPSAPEGPEGEETEEDEGVAVYDPDTDTQPSK